MIKPTVVVTLIKASQGKISAYKPGNRVAELFTALIRLPFLMQRHLDIIEKLGFKIIKKDHEDY